MKERDRWYRVPASYRDRFGVEKPVASNTWLPRYAYQVGHAHTAHEKAVYDFLHLNKKVLAGDLGWIVRDLSVAKIAAGVQLPVSTVRDQLRSLAAKHSVVAWNVVSGTAQPRRRGDYGGTTSWRLPTFAGVLAARRADPRIGIGGKRGTAFWVFGPGRRFLTPEEVLAWGLEEFTFEAFGVRAAVLGAAESEFAGSGAEPAIATAAPSPSPTPSPPVPAATATTLPAEVKDFLAHVTKGRCTPKQAKAVVALARQTAAALGAAVSDAEILDLLKLIRDKASGRRLEGQYFVASIAEQVEWWIGAAAAEAAAEEAARPKREAAERRGRVSSLADYLCFVEDPELEQESRIWMQRTIDEADPVELAEARAMERPFGRSATG